MGPDYKAAFNILMDYWDYIPEEERYQVDKRLKKALDDTNNPPENCINNAMNKLRDECGFGIPDKPQKWKKDPIIIKAMEEEFNK